MKVKKAVSGGGPEEPRTVQDALFDRVRSFWLVTASALIVTVGA